MSSAPSPYYFRRRTIGRAASPPTWACYEQIYDEDEYSESGSDSCSEDEEGYPNAAGDDPASDSDDGEHVVAVSHRQESGNEGHDVDNMDMEIDQQSTGDPSVKNVADIKGKQRAIDPEPESPRRHHRKKPRQRVHTLRPILTIHRSQGFVWNQDLFVPPYIKDRYVASTSPPNCTGFLSTSVSSTNSGFGDYEVEVVEIRVQEGELEHIIP